MSSQDNELEYFLQRGLYAYLIDHKKCLHLSYLGLMQRVNPELYRIVCEDLQLYELLQAHQNLRDRTNKDYKIILSPDGYTMIQRESRIHRDVVKEHLRMLGLDFQDFEKFYREQHYLR